MTLAHETSSSRDPGHQEPRIRRVGESSGRAGFLDTFFVEHSLNDHPLLALESIAELAQRLDPQWVEYGSEDAPKIVGFQHERNPAPANPREAVMTIKGQNRIVYLDHIESVAGYRELVADLAPEVRDVCEIDAADVVKSEGYLFISGGPSTTMAHVDHECNILMVVEGTKRVWLSDMPDIDADRAVESMYAGGYGSCDRMPESMTPHDIHAGQGVFIAPRAAHMIENHPGRCVALSIVVTPKFLEEEGKVFRANARLRQLGLRPQPPGINPRVDARKRRFEDTVVRIDPRRS